MPSGEGRLLIQTNRSPMKPSLLLRRAAAQFNHALCLNSLVALLYLSLPTFAQEKFNANSAEWQIPYMEPKDPLWFEDWNKTKKAIAESSDQKQQAILQMRLGDRAKMGEQYAAAVKYYQKALQLDPTLAMASYQLACNYALWENPKEAKKAFDHAIGIGFSDYASSYADDELGAIRQLPDFTDKMRMIRDRYLKLQKSLVGQPVVFHPKGKKKPEAGWPVIVMLHGHSDSNLSYLPECSEWAKLGILAIAIPGSIPSLVDGYNWSADSIEPTHKDIQATLNSALLKDHVDKNRIILFGFSQGAMHALGLLKTQSMHYAGIVALSPGGKPMKYLYPGELDAKHPRRLYFIYGKAEPHGPVADLYRKACQNAQWPFKLLVHPGGHEFPENWEEQRAPAMRFMFESSR
jgi:predicted esterase